MAESAFAGSPGTMTDVAMKAMPMGWISFVGLSHNCIRNMVCKICKQPSNLGLERVGKIVHGDAIVTSMDGFDDLPRLKIVECELRDWIGDPILEAFMVSQEIKIMKGDDPSFQVITCIYSPRHLNWHLIFFWK